MISVLNKLDRILVYLSGIGLFTMMVLIFSNAVSRFLLNKPIAGVIEFTGEYLMVIIVYLSLSFTHKNSGHVNVEFVRNYLSDKVNNLLDILVNVISLIIFSVLTYATFMMYLDYLKQNIQTVSSLSYPLAAAVFLISLGSFILCIRLLIMIYEKLSKTSFN